MTDLDTAMEHPGPSPVADTGFRDEFTDETLATTSGPFSILFPDGARDPDAELRTEPEYFGDLNLDQFVAAVTARAEQYDLAPFFYEHLEDAETIRYRQDVFEDLERQPVFEAVAAFAKRMRDMREFLEQTRKLHYHYQQERWFIDTVEVYLDAVQTLAEALKETELHSLGMQRLRAVLTEYVESAGVATIVGDGRKAREALSEVHYAIRIRGNRVFVMKYEGEADYSQEVLSTFERFKQGAAKDYRIGFREPPEMNHIETNVLNLVARHYPETFALLDAYFQHHQGYLDPTIGRFDREIEFYLSYLEYVRPLRAAGCDICRPEVTRETKAIFATDTFDLVLATKLVSEKAPVVPNDVRLEEGERILVVSGPNQGGKTTYARTFGQLHHLANLGCPVPGRAARLYRFDLLFAQFEREEQLSNMTGKLEDDLVRVRAILSAATTDSIIVLNEIFASTTLQDSLFLGTRVMEKLVDLDVLAVFVTFVDELARFGPSVVSMVSMIVPENPAVRTYKVVRRPADGIAFALALAEKYGLTYDLLHKRVTR
jgi:DNA mismatch repair ATPase MutS